MYFVFGMFFQAFGMFALLEDDELTPSKAFAALSLFNILQVMHLINTIW